MRLSVYALVVARAAKIAGGVDALAAELGYSRSLLRACITGSYETPTVIFLKVVDYLMDRDGVFVGKVPFTENPAPPSGGEQSPH
jgi:hypothetical protein